MGSKAKQFLSVTEAAQRMGVSRTYVLKLIKNGKIKANLVGKTYAIPASSLPGIHRVLSETERKQVEKAVDKTLRDFGDVIKKLGAT